MFLNPEFCYSAGFNYWYKLLLKNKPTTSERLEKIAQEVAVVQLSGFSSSTAVSLKDLPDKFKNLQIKLINALLKHKSEEQKFVISRAPWAGILNKELLDKKQLKEKGFTGNDFKNFSPHKPYIPEEFYHEYGIK